MGLSSSQARLLTLTSRQHSIEGEAQRIQANKLRLANDSDKVYMKYLNALDETSLQTKQTKKSTGASSWIGGSVNNLLRYGASDEYSGNVFYVQDLETGKLYLPEIICNNFNSAEENGDYTAVMDFVKKCDSSIEYEKVDHNEYILKNYERAVALGYQNSASDEIIEQYNIELEKDNKIIDSAQSVLYALPKIDSNGFYRTVINEDQTLFNLQESMMNLRNNPEYSNMYTQKEREVIESLFSLADAIYQSSPIDKVVVENQGEGTERTHKFTEYYIKQASSTLSGKKYQNTSYFNYYNSLVCALNGGNVSFTGSVHHVALYTNLEAESDFFTQYRHSRDVLDVREDFSDSINIYDMEIPTSSGESVKAADVLKSYNSSCDSFGAAINSIFTNRINKTNNASNYLKGLGKTYSDLENYNTYKKIKDAYDNYVPDIEYVPSDKTRAAYYEQIYNAIKSAGGCIEVKESQAKNEAWVGNMIKSTQVILTAWDEEREMLSKTLPSLNTHIQEVSDAGKIEQVGQEYESELAIINQKDARFDKRLAVLESERSAITMEMDSLKQIMKANIETNFKVFS